MQTYKYGEIKVGERFNLGHDTFIMTNIAKHFMGVKNTTVFIAVNINTGKMINPYDYNTSWITMDDELEVTKSI